MPELLSEVFAPPAPNYTYWCTVTRVVDGDTVDVNIDMGWNFRNIDRVRLMGIDTPESRTRNKKEKVLGLAAKERIKELVKNANLRSRKRGKKDIVLQTTKDGKGKFGRILGYLWVNGENVNDILIRENHARPYFGGSKGEFGPWTKDIDGVTYRWTANGYVEFPS